MITANTLRTIDYAVLAVSGVCMLICFGAAAYAAPWTKAMREARASRQFNRLWLARMIMEIVAALWLLWELLRMLALWGVPSRPGLASNRTSEQLCRIYLAFSLGLLQPLFYLLTLLLCQSSLSPGRKRRQLGQERSAGSVLWLAAAGTLPMLAVQVVLAWFSKIFQSHDWEARNGSLPRYFFGVYNQGNAEQCAAASGGCIVCIYPAAMIIVSGIFSLTYLLGLCIVSSKLASRTINRRLLRRMRTLELGMDVLVVAGLALAGASVSTNPFNLVWQLLIIFYRASACLAALLATWLLVVVPVFVAKSADKQVAAEWHDDSGDLEEALTSNGSQLMASAPQEMVLLDKRGPGTLSDDVDASSVAEGSDTGGSIGGGSIGGGSSHGGGSIWGAGGSRRSLLQPASISSSYSGV